MSNNVIRLKSLRAKVEISSLAWLDYYGSHLGFPRSVATPSET